MAKTIKKSEEAIEKNEKTAAKAPEKVTEKVSEKEILVENEGKLGAILKQARLKEGKKIAEASQFLCIRKVYLEAIEESNYDELPEMPYAIGFIRSYADYLGLDSAQMARLYKSETDARYNKNNKMYVLEPQQEATVPGKKYLVISLLAIIVVYAAWYIYNKSHNSVVVSEPEAISETSGSNNQFPLVVEDYALIDEATTEDAPEVIDVAPVEEVNAEQVVVSEESYPEAVIEAEDTDVAPAVSAPAKTNIVLKIKKETWIEVKNKDKLYISKVLNEGDQYVIPEGEGMILSVGRYDGVDVFVGEEKVDIISPNKKTNINLKRALENAKH